MSRPPQSNPHETRVAFLHALAATSGCHRVYNGALPDGRRPDVLRLDTDRNMIFIGDGKDTESPGCTATLARLAGYFRWLRVHVQDRGGAAVFAICFGNRDHHRLWLPAIQCLAAEVCISPQEADTVSFDSGLMVAWLTFGDNRCRVLRRPRA